MTTQLSLFPAMPITRKTPAQKAELRRKYFEKAYPRETRDQITARLQKPVQGYRMTPEQRLRARRVSAVRGRSPHYTEAQINERVDAIEQRIVARNGRIPKDPAVLRQGKRFSQLRRKHSTWSPEQVRDYMAKLDSGEITRNGQPPKRKSAVRRSPGRPTRKADSATEVEKLKTRLVKVNPNRFEGKIADTSHLPWFVVWGVGVKEFTVRCKPEKIQERRQQYIEQGARLSPVVGG